jgi:L-ribulose-5-phosphate 3-epimerase
MAQVRSRRDFMKTIGAGVAAGVLAGTGATAAPQREYKVSLALWSLHKAIGAKKVDMLDVPKMSAQEFGIDGLELVSTLLASTEKSYLDTLAKNAADNNVKMLLIMVDGQGDIASEAEEKRNEAVENHKKWIDTAQYLGCHSIRMNWAGAPKDVVKEPVALRAAIERSVPGFRALADYGDGKNINVIIENHGGPSSYPEAVVQLMETVDHERFGTLPDFGNFPEEVDRYLGIDILMNYAKAVSAKCYDFDPQTGLETKLDYPRIISTVVDKHGYNGYIGIEYEGDRLSEPEGIVACKKLLDRLREGNA